MPKLDISELVDRFPDFRVTLIVAEGLTIPPDRSAALDAEIAAAEAECRARWQGTDLSAIPGVAAWRGAYRAFGIKKTSYRSSVERLIKRVMAGEALPRINGLVDLYNAVSLEAGLCLGADDLDRTEGDLCFRYARDDDSFHDMAPAEAGNPLDPPKQGEVVYADSRHVLCRRWNWRQDARTIVTPETHRVAITAQANGAGDPEAAAEGLMRRLMRECGGVCRAVTADAQRPVHPF